RIRAQLGRDYPLYIGREAVPSGGPPIVDASPIDTGVMLGRFATATPEQVGRAVTAARAAQRDWARRPWRDRLAILRRAASLIRERKFELAAIMALEVGKSRLESMGDAEEAADLIDSYGQGLEDANGVVFTRSKAVGMHIHHGLSRQWIKPCLLEMGGKNAAIVMDSADLDAAAEGITRSAFGLQNQKCSATSRVYVHQRVARALVEKLIEKTKALKLGDPTERDVFFGPVINAAAVERFARAVAQARQEGTVLEGGERLQDGRLGRGHFVAPTIVRLPLSSSLFVEELFVPILAVGEVAGLEQAIAEANKAEYGLTAGIFSKRPEEIERFFDEIEAGVCYVNKRTGATTGA